MQQRTNEGVFIIKKNNEEIIARISDFDDTPELCRWLSDYREELRDFASAETIYYLEEIRQNLVGMNDLLQEIRKNYNILSLKNAPPLAPPAKK